jgi:putative inorganic carbon (hco3(-)) transporter
MPIRDILITLSVLGSLPFCFFRPWIGVLVWSWLAYMNPHRYAWDFAHDLPFAMMVAVATLAGLFFTSDRKGFLWTRETLTLLVLWAWFTVTSAFAMYPEIAWDGWQKISKILVMTLVVVPLFQDRKKLRGLLLVIAGSLGFFGAKAGVFVLSSAGADMVLGPPDSFIASNNEVALALNMALPLLHFLAREEPRRWLRRVLRVAFWLSVLAVPFTYSRGGFLGLVLVLALLFLNSRSRLILLPLALVGLTVFMAFAPQRWFSRVETLEDYQADESAQLRLMSWRVAYDIAADRPVFGGGFRVLTERATYDIYLPEYPRSFGHDAHSIYFNLLGEHGWVGLGIFSVLIVFSMTTLGGLGRRYRSVAGLEWVSGYARMLQISLAAYLLNGAFLSVAYFDLAYGLLILVPVLKALAVEKAAASAEASESAAPTAVLPVGRGAIVRGAS